MAITLELYQLRSYLFFCVCEHLLGKSGFAPATICEEEGIRPLREYGCEVKGRVQWHDVDGVYVFTAATPFMQPLRLCVEARFFDRKLGKSHIREFMGKMQDIREMYLRGDDALYAHHKQYTNQGVFFSMNGFTSEAEELAAAHGIQTISYAAQPLMEPLYRSIVDASRWIQERVTFANPEEISAFLQDVRKLIAANDAQAATMLKETFGDELLMLIDAISDELQTIQTSLFVTNNHGVYLHALSRDVFLLDAFMHTDEGICQIHLEKRGRKKYHYFTVNDGIRRYYFTRPSFLGDDALLGVRPSMQQSLFDMEEEQRESVFQLCVPDQGIMRYLRLGVEGRLWID